MTGRDKLLRICTAGLRSLLTYPSAHRRRNSSCICHALMVALEFLTLSTRLLFTFLRFFCLLLTSCQRAERADSTAYKGVQHAFECLNRIAGTDLQTTLLHTTPRQHGRKIRYEFYDALTRHMRDLCPWLQLTGLPVASDVDMDWRWQSKVLMSWYTASPQTYLQAAPLRRAMAQHLGLPIYQPGQHCRYTPLTTGRACGQQLGTSSSHPATCAQGPAIRSHNRLRDQWILLCRRAGWHTDP